MRILFVCLGNICRSPTALAAARESLADAGLDGRVELDSAGLGDWHVGNPPDPRMRTAAADDGLQLTGAARQVQRGELSDWDLVLAMDRSNLRRLRDMAGDDGVRDRIHLFRDFDPDADGDEVPDPYYGGPDGFREVVAICRAAAAGLADHVADRLDDGR
jgi:protein-tyrosine phosphatase